MNHEITVIGLLGSPHRKESSFLTNFLQELVKPGELLKR